MIVMVEERDSRHIVYWKTKENENNIFTFTYFLYYIKLSSIFSLIMNCLKFVKID